MANELDNIPQVIPVPPERQDDIRALERMISVEGLNTISNNSATGLAIYKIRQELVSNGNKRIPDLYKQLYAEQAICALLIARNAFMYLARNPQPVDEADADDDVARSINRNYDRALAAYSKAVRTLLDNIKALGYEGNVIYGPMSIQEIFEQMEKETPEVKAINATLSAEIRNEK